MFTRLVLLAKRAEENSHQLAADPLAKLVVVHWASHAGPCGLWVGPEDFAVTSLHVAFGVTAQQASSAKAEIKSGACLDDLQSDGYRMQGIASMYWIVVDLF